MISCNSAFEQGNLDLWRYINGFIIIIIYYYIIIIFIGWDYFNGGWIRYVICRLQLFPELSDILVRPLIIARDRYETMKQEQTDKQASRRLASVTQAPWGGSTVQPLNSAWEINGCSCNRQGGLTTD